MSTPGHLEALLDELEAVLETERQALRKLDTDAISRAADDKLRLDAELRRAPMPTHSIELQHRFERVQNTARINQILIAHARSCVQGMLALLTGHQTSNGSRASAPPPPVAINLRG